MELKSRLFRQWIAAIVANIAFFMAGMFLGWSSPTHNYLRSPDSRLYLTKDEHSWVVSAMFIGSSLSPVPTGWLMNRVGRKMALMILACVALASWLLLIIAESPALMYLSRFLGGVWFGSVLTVVPVFMCEFADPTVRASLSTLIIAMTELGIIFVYAVGAAASYDVLNAAAAAVPLVFIAAFAWIPESPYFYLMKGKTEKAEQSLAWFRCKTTTEVQNELLTIQSAVAADMQHKGRFQDLVSTAGNRKALLISAMLAVTMRMSGISSMTAFASKIIVPVGDVTPNVLAITVVLCQMVVGFCGPIFTNRYSRRTLLAVSCAGCGVANVVTASWFYLDQMTCYDARQISIVPLLAFSIYMLFFVIGLGNVPPMIQGEMFPSNTRGLASGVSSTIISITSFLTVKIFFSLEYFGGFYLNFVIFSLFCFYGVFFAIRVVIETKGKTMEAIQRELVEHTARKMANNTVQPLPIK